MDPVGRRNYIIGILLFVIAILILSSFFGFRGPFSPDIYNDTQSSAIDTATTDSATTTPAIESEELSENQEPHTSSEIPEETTQNKALSPTRAETSPTSLEDESVVVVVTYTDSGFIPPVIEVEAGNTVTFINSSSKPLWVTSEYHPTAKGQYYPEFDQGRSVAIGGTYTFQFTKIGVWGYKNLNNENHLGAVSVTAQQ